MQVQRIWLRRTSRKSKKGTFALNHSATALEAGGIRTRDDVSQKFVSPFGESTPERNPDIYQGRHAQVVRAVETGALPLSYGPLDRAGGTRTRDRRVRSPKVCKLIRLERVPTEIPMKKTRSMGRMSASLLCTSSMSMSRRTIHSHKRGWTRTNNFPRWWRKLPVCMLVV